MDGTITLSTAVRDLDAAIAWFKETLGFEEQFKVAEAGWAEVSTPVEGVTVGLIQSGEAPTRLACTNSTAW